MIAAATVHAQMRALPLADAASILKRQPALILAPHPDDEVLGCGALIAGAVAANNPPVVVMLTDGAASHPGSRAYPPERLRALREDEARAAVAVLGLPAPRLRFLRFADAAAPHDGPAFDDAVACICDVAGEFGCRTICAPWAFDPHCDHLAAHRIAAAAAARLGVVHLSYPVWGWTLDGGTQLPATTASGWRLDCAPVAGLKRRALAEHRSQLGGVITDAPGGFVLDPATIARISPPFEVFLENP